MFLDEVTYKIVICFAVLSAGFIISKIGEKSITCLWRKKYRATIERVQIARIFSLTTNIIFIIIALSFLKINITENTLIEIYSRFPLLLSAILLGVLIFLGVRLIFFVIDTLLSTSGIRTIVEEYGQEQGLASLLLVLRYVLYVVFGLLALDSLGVNIDPTLFVFKVVLYPLLLLALVLVFAGLKPYAENFFSGLFLKNMNFLRVGEQVRIEDENYTIRALKSQGIILKGKDSFSAFVPYNKLYRQEVKYREIMYDLTALESIKNHFVAQHPSYCGPASASMVLKIFGYDISQEEIGKMAMTVVPSQKRLDKVKVFGGTHPKELIRAVEKLTDGKVRGVWINIDKINDLKLELKTWLANKALVVIDYKKSFLFPEAEKAHYSVCFSIMGGELLVLDPSTKKGGVYFADIKKVYLGMSTYSEFLKGKRGYVVFAPKGTTAYHRIEEGLIYSDAGLYKNLSNSLTKELDRLMRQVSKVENILPKSVQKVINEHKKKEKITRIWRPGTG